jgi:hypothetical protein
MSTNNTNATVNNNTKATLRIALADKGVVLKDSEFRTLKKAELQLMLVKAIAEEMEEMGADGDIALEYAMEQVDTSEQKVDKARLRERNRVVLSLVVAWVYQTIYPFSNDKALFYRAKDPKYTGLWLAEGRRLARVTGDALMLLYNVKLSGKQFNRQVALAYNLMIEAGLCHINGKYIAMNDTERARCVRYYNSDRDFIKDSIAIYERFISRK